MYFLLLQGSRDVQTEEGQLRRCVSPQATPTHSPAPHRGQVSSQATPTVRDSPANYRSPQNRSSESRLREEHGSYRSPDSQRSLGECREVSDMERERSRESSHREHVRSRESSQRERERSLETSYRELERSREESLRETDRSHQGSLRETERRGDRLERSGGSKEDSTDDLSARWDTETISWVYSLKFFHETSYKSCVMTFELPIIW